MEPLAQDVVDDFSEVAFEAFAAGDFEAAWVEAELVQYGGVDVGHVVPVLDAVEPDLVRLPVDHAALDPASSHPGGEGKHVVIAAAAALPDRWIAIGAGTDVAIEASDLTLVRGDLRAAPDAIRLARATLRTIKGNLFWAFAYNVAALPLAAAGLEGCCSGQQRQAHGQRAHAPLGVKKR